VWRIDKETNAYPSAIWTRAVDGTGEPLPVDVG